MKRLHHPDWRLALSSWQRWDAGRWRSPQVGLNFALGLSILAFVGVKWWAASGPAAPAAAVNTATAANPAIINTPGTIPELQLTPAYLPPWGPRHQFNYDQWVTLLQQEAIAVSAQQPDHLNILIGDSITLWFPPDLLPTDRTWLNQGISGDTAIGVLNRLELLDRTQPDTLFIMIGINDLIRGRSPAIVLEQTRRMVEYLADRHPDTTIVIQSILPHAGAAATWEGRAKLLTLPNSRIEELNQALAAIVAEAHTPQVQFLNLYPLFIDTEGKLNAALTTDGLHLNRQGYWVWRTALHQMLTAPPAPPPSTARAQEVTEFGRL